MGFLYLGEDAGGEVLRYGVGLSRVGLSEYGLDLITHEAIPAGPGGVCVFRRITVPVRYTNGAHIGVTPYVDGVPLTEQQFSALGVGQLDCDVRIAKRGSRIKARVRSIGALTGEIEVIDARVGYVPLRAVP